MKIPINKDIEKEYKDQFMRGFSAKECAYIAVGLVCGGIVAFAVEAMFHLPINVCFYIGIPFAIPSIVIGFADFQGLNFFELIKELIYEHKTKELYYDADEIKTVSPAYTMSRQKLKRDGKLK